MARTKQTKRKRKSKVKNEEVKIDEGFSMRFEDQIPAKPAKLYTKMYFDWVTEKSAISRVDCIKQEPVEERKAFVEVATQTETLETDVEVLKAMIQNLIQRVDSGFKEADERMARIQETIEKSNGLNSQQAVTSKVNKSQPGPIVVNLT